MAAVSNPAATTITPAASVAPAATTPAPVIPPAPQLGQGDLSYTGGFGNVPQVSNDYTAAMGNYYKQNPTQDPSYVAPPATPASTLIPPSSAPAAITGPAASSWANQPAAAHSAMPGPYTPTSIVGASAGPLMSGAPMPPAGAPPTYQQRLAQQLGKYPAA